jgi:hypothetical protein
LLEFIENGEENISEVLCPWNKDLDCKKNWNSRRLSEWPVKSRINAKNVEK